MKTLMERCDALGLTNGPLSDWVDRVEAQQAEIAGWEGGYANLLHEHQLIADGLRAERDALAEQVKVLREAVEFAMYNEGELDRDNRWCCLSKALATGDGE